MPASANLSKILFGLLVLNAVAILAVPALRPAFAKQEPEKAQTAAPEVQIPDDPPSLPAQTNSAPKTPVLADENPSPESPSPAKSDTSSPANRMVLDEILKVIQDDREDLSVPKLDYPPLAPQTKSDSGNNVGNNVGIYDIDQLSLRFKSLAEVTRTAQALLKEAEQLKAKGKVAAARDLTEHVRTLKSIIVQLAADEAN